MKRFGIIAVPGVLVLLVLAAGMSRQTFLLGSVADAQALWNDEKLFVVVQKRVAVLRTSGLVYKLAQVSGIPYPLPRALPEDLMVVQVQNGEIRRTEFPRVGRVGNIFPHGGRIYFLRGSEAKDYPALHQLLEGKLEPVSREEAERIMASFQLETELLQREGWQKRDLYFTEGPAGYPIQQGAQTLKLMLTQTRKTGVVKIELVDEQTKAAQALYELSNQRRKISEADYRKLISSESSAATNR
jgi:hypothetical protein